MNGNCSTTGLKSLERLPDTDRLEYQWKSIDWKKAETEVNRLQARIAKATQEKKWNTVRRLQYLLTHSYRQTRCGPSAFRRSGPRTARAP